MRRCPDTTPKPLLQAGGKPLIVWQIEGSCARDSAISSSMRRICQDRFVETLGDGAALRGAPPLVIRAEPLEVAGGIATALPLLPPGPALIVAGDVYTAFDYRSFREKGASDGARLERRARPPRARPESAVSPAGDFALVEGGSRWTARRDTRTRASASTTRRSSANFLAGRRSNFFRTSNGG
jgi:MurNAc alpha-1-phosphate uridylyltransferase